MTINNKALKYNAGVTLIELMITVTIVAILGFTALPSFSNLIKENRASSKANELVSALYLARSEALKRSHTVTFCASENQKTCSSSKDFSKGWIIFLDCNEDLIIDKPLPDCGANNEEEIIRVGEGSDSIHLRNNKNKKISFSFSGRSAKFASTFSIGKDSSSILKKVVINRVGRVKTKDP